MVIGTCMKLVVSLCTGETAWSRKVIVRAIWSSLVYVLTVFEHDAYFLHFVIGKVSDDDNTMKF